MTTQYCAAVRTKSSPIGWTNSIPKFPRVVQPIREVLYMNGTLVRLKTFSNNMLWSPCWLVNQNKINMIRMKTFSRHSTRLRNYSVQYVKPSNFKILWPKVSPTDKFYLYHWFFRTNYLSTKKKVSRKIVLRRCFYNDNIIIIPGYSC